MSIGIVVPIDNYAQSPVPTIAVFRFIKYTYFACSLGLGFITVLNLFAHRCMKHHLARVQLIERLGFKALWLGDVPFNVATFGDAGQTFDPFSYLGYLAGLTTDIALGFASIAYPYIIPFT